MAYYTGVDVSWPQGNYTPPASASFVGVGAVSADGGSAFVQKTYHQQVDNAHNAGKPVMHYAFNGRYDPAALANYLMDNLYHFQTGDAIVLDVESSQGGTYPAYTPSQGQAFANQIAARRGLSTQAARTGIYGNRTDMGRAGWGAVEKSGSWLWLAWPGAESSITHGEWSDWSIWQYTIAGGVDQNYSKQTLAQIIGGGSAAPQYWESDMYALRFQPWGTWDFVISPGFFKNCPADQASFAGGVTGFPPMHLVPDQYQMTYFLWMNGMQEFIPKAAADPQGATGNFVPGGTMAFMQSLVNGGFAVASWLKTPTTPPSPLLSDAQINAIGAQVAAGITIPAAPAAPTHFTLTGDAKAA